MNGSVTVRQAEDLEGGALTYAEIKAIASGNPAVMEKVKVDTEIRKLDQLRSSHINQQHNIRWQVKSLPEQIERARKYHAAVSADIVTRDARADEEFAMTVGNRVYTGKGAREDAGNALTAVVLSRRDDVTVKVRGHFRGFEILSRGSDLKDREPDLFVRGREAYKANLNLENPLGTISSIEHTIRSLDRLQYRGELSPTPSVKSSSENRMGSIARASTDETLMTRDGALAFKRSRKRSVSSAGPR